MMIAMEMTLQDLVPPRLSQVTTLLALLLTVVATGGLFAADKAKRFEQCCGLLAVEDSPAWSGVEPRLKMTAAIKANSDPPLQTDACATGCALSLSFGLIATVVGAATRSCIGSCSLSCSWQVLDQHRWHSSPQKPSIDGKQPAGW